MKFEDSIKELKGIGEKNAALFRKLNIETIADLIFHFPRGYDTYPAYEAIATCLSSAKTKGSILACVSTKPTLSRVKGMSIVRFQAKDEFGKIMYISYFNMPFLKNSIKSGTWYVFYGNITIKNNLLGMTQPKMFKKAEYDALLGQLQPIYMTTKGLASQSIGKYCKLALTSLSEVEDYLPSSILQVNQFPSIMDCLKQIHMPENENLLHKARERLAYEDFLFFFIAMKSQNSFSKSKFAYEMIETADANRLIEQLPYQLTKSQLHAFEQIKADMLSEHCMNRLLQGDVGSGKTIVAILALLLCVSNGFQGALMAPTEVLATQHMETIQAMTNKYQLPFKPVLLTGVSSAKQKKEIYARIEDHTYNLVIGTHAVIQENVKFDNLALVVTDEQHRFGVKQREELVNKGGNIHTIVMSATPIPRSLGMILYGDLDITEMKELPSNRLKIKNCVVDQNYRQTAYQFMQKQIEENHQVYIICPMAQPGVMEELENVVDYATYIKPFFKEQTRIAYLHGKMKSKDKNEIMDRFSNGEIDILVSTTVIEVGINVPNATVMMVENAERFGLATLHQIRGRVGRSDQQSYCIFMQSNRLDKKNERLDILNHSNDGFEIANEDLKLRGPGDFMGIVQSGSFQFRFADIYRDAEMLKIASKDATLIVQDKLLQKPEYRSLQNQIDQYLQNGYMHVL